MNIQKIYLQKTSRWKRNNIGAIRSIDNCLIRLHKHSCESRANSRSHESEQILIPNDMPMSSKGVEAVLILI